MTVMQQLTKSDRDIRKKLKDAGFNPDKPLSFMLLPEYSPFKSILYPSPEELIRNQEVDDLGLVTIDYYIWTKWLSQTQRHKVNPGIFDMGVNRKPRRLSHSLLYQEIKNEELEQDVEYEDGAHVEEIIRQKIMGEKSSIKSKLRDVGLHVDRYGSEQMYELLKLMKLLYWYEKSSLNRDKVQVLSILANPSIANQDQSDFGRQSPHGKVITELKYAVRKEVDDEFARRAAVLTTEIINQWDRVHLHVLHLLNRKLPAPDVMEELNRIYMHLQSVLDRVEMDGSSIDYEEKLMHAFYLKIHQLDKLSRMLDVQRASSHICHSAYTQRLIKTMHQNMFPFKDIEIPILVSYLEANLEHVTQLVYEKEDVSKKDMSYVQKRVEQVQELKRIYDDQIKGTGPQPMTLSFVIAAMQEIFLTERLAKDDPEAVFVNEYFKSRRTPRTLSSALKNLDAEQKYDDEIFEIIWVVKIQRRLFAFLGLLEHYVMITRIREQIDQLVFLLMKLPNLDAMVAVNDYFLDQLFLTKKETVGRYQQGFVDAIKSKTGYDCTVLTRRVFSFFDKDELRIWFTDLIVGAINGTYDMSGWNRDGEVYWTPLLDEHILLIEIKHAEKVFVLGRFIPMSPNEDIPVLQRNGLHRLIIT